MPRRTRDDSLAFFCLLVPGIAIAGCGSSSGVPQPSDAATVPDATTDASQAPDASVCACPGRELLSEQHLRDTWYRLEVNEATLKDLACEDAVAIHVNGTCSFVDLAGDGSLSVFDFSRDKQKWRCRRAITAQAFMMSVRCVQPLDHSDQIGADCDCPALETPLDRIVFPEQIVTIPGAGIAEVTTTCPQGSILLGGGCTGGHDGWGDGLIISAGPHRDDPQTWHCSWSSYSINPLDGKAMAMCLTPPGPDAVTGEPIAPETIEHVFVEETLPANNTRIVDATCDPGDTLIAGGCHLEGLDTTLQDLRLKRIGLAHPDDNRPNTWQCAWRNPTEATPRVFAMATCLKPAALTSP